TPRKTRDTPSTRGRTHHSVRMPSLKRTASGGYAARQRIPEDVRVRPPQAASAKTEAEEGLKLRVAEKEEQIASMQRQIDELKRKAEQGSQQLQGEVQELVLEEMLRTRFSRDVIEPVPKGEFGGDVLQRVIGPTGQECGKILWESKR